MGEMILSSYFTVDAAYEGVQKRTFLAMLLCAVFYALILVGMLLLYPKLAPPTPSKANEEDSDSEMHTLSNSILKHMDSLSDSDYMP